MAEVDGAHSIDCCWMNSHMCFTCCKSYCYKLMTFFCALPLAMFWGCEFAVIVFQVGVLLLCGDMRVETTHIHIYILTPTQNRIRTP